MSDDWMKPPRLEKIDWMKPLINDALRRPAVYIGQTTDARYPYVVATEIAPGDVFVDTFDMYGCSADDGVPDLRNAPEPNDEPALVQNHSPFHGWF